MLVSPIHLMGVTVLRAVVDDESRSDVAALVPVVRQHLMPGATVALDLLSDPVEIRPMLAAIERMQREASRRGARLLVVENDPMALSQMLGHGLPDVYDSLDSALAPA